MKEYGMMFASCALLLFTSSAAYSAAEGTYMSLNGGIAALNDGDAKTRIGTVGLEMDPGLALAAAAGYDFGNHFRMETELAYQQNDVEKLKKAGAGLNSSGETSSVAGLLNGYYDFANHTAVTPFVSAGIGAAKVSLSDLNFPGSTLDSDGTAVAYQAGAGFSYDLNYELALDFKYRYFSAVDLKIDDTELDYSSHNFYGGIRAAF